MQTKAQFVGIAASVLALSLLGTPPGVAQDVNQSEPQQAAPTQAVPAQAAPAQAPAAPVTSGGWRKFQPADQNPDQVAGNPAQQAPASVNGAPVNAAPDPAQGPDPAQAGPQPQGLQQQGAPQQQVPPPQGPPPPQFRPEPQTITLPAGTWVTIRVNQPLSSDRNQVGDAFTGTLLEPIIANGLLIARRGETVSGIVSEAKKAGRVSGTSRLGLELTEIQLADGRQVQVKTTLMERRGNTSYGRDAAAIGTTTAVGAAIGAGVNGGVGAGVGAGAGLVVSTIGVLLTRGRATVVYPETPLTFRMQTPLAVDNSQQAFQYVTQRDYNAGVARPMAPRAPYGPGYGYAAAPPPPYGYYAPVYGYPYPYPYYYGYGPGLYLGFGGRWGYGRRW
ncbi:MAG: hypothetical protein JOZ32_17340 [Bryobacterales bacterium]|nr:hypothetical protein [Bryobacterales bacterium]